MEIIIIYKVCQCISEEVVELAMCTSQEYAEKAIDRLVNENYEDRDSLFIVKSRIVLNTIYGWEDGDLTT